MGKPATPASVAASHRANRQIREKSTGARSIVRSLEELGVEVVFGLPGGAILPTYDPIFQSTKLRHILVRHEQGAGHAAEGYALATGKVGVCIATSGPGATNLVTALLDAHMDSVPLVAITGQVGASAIGTDAFQEADIVGISMPVTKHSFLVTDPAEIPARLAEAFHIASTGRPGPVLVDVTKSAQVGEADFVWPPQMDLPGYHPVTDPNQRQVKEAARLIAAAQRPVMYVGGGAIRAQASSSLLALSELGNIPVVTTLTARGAIPGSHPNNLGMPGMHGDVPAVLAMQQADLLITLGARFDDRVTGKLDDFAPDAKVIHIDIDPAEISKNRPADVPIVGDVRKAVDELIVELRAAQKQHGKPELDSWWKQIAELREKFPVGWEEVKDGLLEPQYIISRLAAVAGTEDTIYVTGVGQHQMWASQFLNHEIPGRFLTSAGAGTMGYGIPAAMGAKVGRPNSTVWVIDGDGSFQMTNQELATCRLNNINIKVCLINNSSLGMVRQWQTLFYGSRYSHTDLNTGAGTVRIPNFVKLAEAYDCAAWTVEEGDDVDAAFTKAMEINDRPVLLEFITSPDSEVWPMVSAGVSNDDIIYARSMRPTTDPEAA